MATANTTAFRMKLVVDVARQRVLFAGATRDVVFYLHSLLTSPDVSLPFDNATEAGCIGNLYDSVEELIDAATTPSSACGHQARRFFECGYKRRVGCSQYVAEERGTVCPSCGLEMVAEVPRNDSPGASCSGENASAGGSADAFLMCLLKDDLTVVPVPASEVTLTTGSRASFNVQIHVDSATAVEDRSVLLAAGVHGGFGYPQCLAAVEHRPN